MQNREVAFKSVFIRVYPRTKLKYRTEVNESVTISIRHCHPNWIDTVIFPVVNRQM